MLRMPAFGLDGPWRDRTGFAMTIEQVSGLAWRTGYEDKPLVPRGACDPVGGMHATFADPMGFDTVTLTATYSPQSGLPSDERWHVATEYRRRTAVTLLDTYLGRHAGERVLTGSIKRGDGENIEAVI